MHCQQYVMCFPCSLNNKSCKTKALETEIASCWCSWACDSGDWRSACKDSNDFKEMYSLLLKCHTIIWGKIFFEFCFMLNRCVPSCLCFKVFTFYRGFCKTLTAVMGERNYWKPLGFLKFFFLHTEKVAKGLSISIDTETTCFSQVILIYLLILK